MANSNRADSNKDVVRRFGEVCLGKGEVSLVDELVSPDLVDHDPLPGQPAGRDGIVYAILRLRTAFPDLHVVAEHLVAEGDLVSAHWTVSGTHLGEFAGLPATGRTFTIRGFELHRLADGHIVELWPLFDSHGLFDQLGAFDPDEA